MRLHLPAVGRGRGIAALLVATLLGCQHPESPMVTGLPTLPAETGTAPPRINGNVGAPKTLPPAQVSFGTPQGRPHPTHLEVRAPAISH